MLQIGGSIAGGDGHSSLCLGLVVAVGVDARLERDPERLLPRVWGKVWGEFRGYVNIWRILFISVTKSGFENILRLLTEIEQSVCQEDTFGK